MAHERWIAGRLSTGFIAEEFPDGFEPAAPEGETAHLLAAVAASIDDKMNRRKRRISGQLRAAKPLRVRDGAGCRAGRACISTSRSSARARASIVRLRPGPFARGRIRRGCRAAGVERHGRRRTVAVQVRPILNGVALAHGGVAAKARVFTRREAELAALMPEKVAADTGKQLLCPMPGLVKAILVKEGQEVKAGEMLCIVEAMKMENVLRAEQGRHGHFQAARQGRRQPRRRRGDHGIRLSKRGPG